ncbi:hypothetical protein ACLOJK_000560 [Asimina triloba]
MVGKENGRVGEQTTCDVAFRERASELENAKLETLAPDSALAARWHGTAGGLQKRLELSLRLVSDFQLFFFIVGH